jgi:hypothetical protein
MTSGTPVFIIFNLDNYHELSLSEQQSFHDYYIYLYNAIQVMTNYLQNCVLRIALIRLFQISFSLIIAFIKDISQIERTTFNRYIRIYISILTGNSKVVFEN